MVISLEIISGFLDGELSQDEAQAVEAALVVNTNLQVELALLMDANVMVQKQFAAMLLEPVPLKLMDAIQN